MFPIYHWPMALTTFCASSGGAGQPLFPSDGRSLPFVSFVGMFGRRLMVQGRLSGQIMSAPSRNSSSQFAKPFNAIIVLINCLHRQLL
jgi:hypothetical protein